MTSASMPLARSGVRWWLALPVLAVLGTLAYWRAPGVTTEPGVLAGATMGTSYRVVLGAVRDADSVRTLQRGVDSVLAVVNASMSTYDAQSELSRFNARASTEPVTISAPLAAVLRDALTVHRLSNGAFDVTVGPLVNAWGFGPERLPVTRPADSVIAALRAFVGSEKLQLDGQSLRKSDPRVAVDLSAIAKGYGVDRVSDWLASHGESNHLVEIGGELRARGVSGRGESFRVGIEEPVRTTRAVHTAVALRDRALATSGNYRNAFVLEGVEYAHTINPATGLPVRHGLLSASVLHETCALADAWATALMVAGPDGAWELARANGLDVLLLVAAADGSVQERATPGFSRLVLHDAERGARP